MLLKASLLFGLAAAVPTEDIGSRDIDCKAVNFVVQALKVSPGASRYCSNILGIRPAQRTQTVSTVKTITATKCTTQTVIQTSVATVTSTSTVCGINPQPKFIGRAFKFAQPTGIYNYEREAAPFQTVAARNVIEERAGSCNGAPINGFACSLVSSACGCLSLPTAPGTVTNTKTSITTITVTSAARPKTTVETTTTTIIEQKRVDRENDPLNCGSCGNVCSGETSFCAYGTCVAPCSQGQDYSSDLYNCGSCGMMCPSDLRYSCTNGECTIQE